MVTKDTLYSKAEWRICKHLFVAISSQHNRLFIEDHSWDLPACLEVGSEVEDLLTESEAFLNVEGAGMTGIAPWNWTANVDRVRSSVRLKATFRQGSRLCQKAAGLSWFGTTSLCVTLTTESGVIAQNITGHNWILLNQDRWNCKLRFALTWALSKISYDFQLRHISNFLEYSHTPYNKSNRTLRACLMHLFVLFLLDIVHWTIECEWNMCTK